jgi:acyl-CoA thioesterase
MKAERPFVDHVGVEIADYRAGYSRCVLSIAAVHFNSAGVVHGGVLFTLADTGMGAALYPALPADQACATVEIKINYFRAVTQGELECVSTVVHQGRTMANIESELRVHGQLVAKANGTFAIIPRARMPAT